MLNDEDRVATLADAADLVHQFDFFVAVHARYRLVEQQQFGIGRQGTRQFQFALFAIRKVVGFLKRLVVEFDPRQQLVRPRAGPALFAAKQPGARQQAQRAIL